MGGGVCGVVEGDGGLGTGMGKDVVSGVAS